MDTNNTIEELKELANWAPKYSKEKSDILFRAINIAEKENNKDTIIELKSDYITCLVFQNKHKDALPYFAELVKEVLDEKSDYGFFQRFEVLWMYKWFVVNLANFPNIPKKTILSVLDDLEDKFLAASRSSQKTVYDYQYAVHRELGNVELSADFRNKYEESTERYFFLDDCSACVIHSNMHYLFYKKDYPKAMEVAMPILTKSQVCASKPKDTYPYAALSYYILKDQETAKSYYTKARKFIKDESTDHNYISLLMTFCLWNNNLKSAQSFFNDWFISSFTNPNKKDTLFFLVTSKVFLEEYIFAEKNKLMLNFEVNKYCYIQDNVYETENLISICNMEIDKLVNLFDMRNENTYISTFFIEFYQFVKSN